MTLTPLIRNNTLVILVVGLFIVTSCNASEHDKQTYDIKWWHITNKDQRVQFIAGYIDCVITDKHDDSLINTSWDNIEPKINDYYKLHPKSKYSVPYLVHKFRQTEQPKYVGDYHPGGIFTGYYWSEISPIQRRGYILGYIACLSSISQYSNTKWKSSNWYMDHIDSYYQITSDNVDDRTLSTKLSTLIHKFTLLDNKSANQK